MSVAIRSGGILAAGNGSRLKRDGYAGPKPLARVGDMPLVEHVLSNFAAAGVASVAIIFNEWEEECARFVRQRFGELDLRIVIRTTASSLESLRAIAPFLSGGPALVSTVDAWCPRADFLSFVQAAERTAADETVLAVTSFVQDERPLWASVDATGRVTRLGVESGDVVTAGMYVFSGRALRLQPPPGLGRLRDFLTWLVESGEPVRAVSIPKVVDVDRAEDIATAQAMARAAESEARPPQRPSVARRSGLREGGNAASQRSIRSSYSAAEHPSSEVETPRRRLFGLRASKLASTPEKPRCWGVFRELAHSPGRESDDTEILRATAQRLTERGFDVELKSPDELPESDEASGIPPFLFVMCERGGIVRRLAAWESQGVRVVNSPGAIRNTDRERTIARFSGDGVPFPTSLLVSTADAGHEHGLPFPCWVKRGDVHATQAEDVSLAARPEELAARLTALAARGIASAVLQEHVPGDLIKFYGVAGTDPQGMPLSWFQWFYHRDQALARHGFDPGELRAAVVRAAAALGLDVFGGDAIATPAGRIVLIDLNAWPSFALYRETAAEKIAARLAERFGKRHTLDY